MPIFSLILLLLSTKQAQAYPAFIGYKYSSCLTCHYNGQGNGPLNDYGRAVWAAEIAGRAFSRRSDEQLAASSGFLGSSELPWWIRPGLKARQLYYQTDPAKGTWEPILMQAEGNVALFFDKKQTVTFVGSVGYVPIPRRYTNAGGRPSSVELDTSISREHYLRVRANKSLWLYAGLMDKVYGLRIVNHTAYSRSRTGLAQNDQSHGLVAHYIKPEWEATFNVFAGNLFQKEELRQKGASGLFEYEVQEAWRVGVTALQSANNYIEQRRYGVLTRYGFGEGSALLFELGIIEDTPLRQALRRGYYVYSEAMQKLVRGTHLFVTGQAYRDRFEGNRPDNVRTGLGLLIFPMQRLEIRTEIENTRQITNTSNVPTDTWSLMAQLHLSL